MTVPSAYFTAAGVGSHDDRLGSFEVALRDAGIAPYNLVPVSSVLPPDASRVDAEEGREALDPGEIVHAVLARCATDDDAFLASAVGLATARDAHGYAVERARVGADPETVVSDAEDLARELVDGEPAGSDAVLASGTGATDGWTTAVAAVVFVP